MDTRYERRLDFLMPPPLERKRKAKPEPVVYVFDRLLAPAREIRELPAAVAGNWRRGVAVYGDDAD